MIGAPLALMNPATPSRCTSALGTSTSNCRPLINTTVKGWNGVRLWSPPRTSSKWSGAIDHSLLRLAAGEDAGHEVQHVRRARFIVAVIANQATLHHVDFLLGRLVHHIGNERRQFN